MNNKFIILGLVLLLLSSSVFAIDNIVAFFPMTTNCIENTEGTDGTAGGTPNFVSSTEGCNFIPASSEYIDTTLSFNQNLYDSAFYFSVWANVDAITSATNLAILGASIGSSVVYTTTMFQASDDSWVLQSVNNADGTSSSKTSASSVTANVWTHFAGNINGDGEITEFYVNNVDKGGSSVNSAGLDDIVKSAIGALPWTGTSYVNYFDGKIMGVIYGTGDLTVSDVSTLYNGGRTYNPLVAPPAPKVEVKAFNKYAEVHETEFNVSFTNITSTYNEQTTNGSIFFQYNEKVLYDVDVTGGSYIDYSLTGINLSDGPINASMFQTDLEFKIYTLENTSLLIEHKITLIDNNYTKNISTTNGSIFIQPNAKNISFKFYDSNLYEDNNTYLSFSKRQTGIVKVYMQTPQNVITFKTVSGSPIVNATIEIKYPNLATIEQQTISDGSINFSSFNTGVQYFGVYQITFKSVSGFISPITTNFTINATTIPLIEDVTVLQPGINVDVYDRSTEQLITQLTELYFFNVLNDTSYSGQFIITNQSIIAGDYTLQVVSNGYGTEQQAFTFTSQSNVTVDFYLINLTEANAGTLFVSVIDEYYRVIQDAKVELLEYNPSSKSYILVSECQSNSNGECTFNIELNVKTYIIRASKTIDGRLYTASTSDFGEIIKTDEEVRNLFLRLTQTFEPSPTTNLDISVSETFINNISTIYIDFSTTDNFNTEVCVEYFQNFNNYDTSIYTQCVTSSSGYVATPVLLNRSNSYSASVYQLHDSVKYPIKGYNYPSLNTFSEKAKAVGWDKALILFFWVIIIVFGLASKNITMTFVLAIILSWVEIAMFPNTAKVSASALKTVISLLLIIIARKKEDTP